MRIRISYNKEKEIRFTSALDMHAIWERSFRRAGINILYSQGFHPKPRIQLGLPLPLGLISKNEIVDVWVNENRRPEEINDLLRTKLPDGMKIISTKEIPANEKPLVSQIQASTYNVSFFDKDISKSVLTEAVEKVLNAEKIFRVKRNGKQYDLRPLINCLELIEKEDQSLFLLMNLVSKANATGRADEVVKALGYSISEVLIERISYTYV